MRRVVLICVLLVMCLCSAIAQSSASKWVAELNSTLGSRYAMNISVAVSDDGNVAGYLMVDGDSYYITLGVMEVYSDGKLRYEINNERKEVIEDRVNLESADILTNPTRAFSFVEDEFTLELLSGDNIGAELLLTPKDEEYGISNIRLLLRRDKSGVVPVSMAYDYDGDIVKIALSVVDTDDVKLPQWNKSNYLAYDIVSFL